MSIELDYMEYADDVAAQAAYVGVVTKKIYPSDDAYVRSDSGLEDTNFGSEDEIGASNAGTGNEVNMKSLLKWSLASIPAGSVITEAIFYCYWHAVYTTSGVAVPIAQITSEDWAEGTVTWNNAPTITGELGTWSLWNGVGWYNRDMTALVQDWFSEAENNYGISIERPGGDTDVPAWARSKEYATEAFRPYLEVKYKSVFSEDTIKIQGSYSLKVVAKETDSLDFAVTRTVDPTIDLSGWIELRFYIRASRTGSNIKIGIHNSGGTTTEITPNITNADTWQQVIWDISGVADADKDAIDQIVITVLNADVDNVLYLDDFYAIGVVSKERNIVYDSVLELSKTRDLVYDLLLELSKERNITYDLFAYIAKERYIRYDSVLEVSKAQNILYDLFELIQRLEAPTNGITREDAPLGVPTKENAPVGVPAKEARPTDEITRVDKPVGYPVKMKKPW